MGGESWADLDIAFMKPTRDELGSSLRNAWGAWFTDASDAWSEIRTDMIARGYKSGVMPELSWWCARERPYGQGPDAVSKATRKRMAGVKEFSGPGPRPPAYKDAEVYKWERDREMFERAEARKAASKTRSREGEDLYILTFQPGQRPVFGTQVDLFRPWDRAYVGYQYFGAGTHIWPVEDHEVETVGWVAADQGRVLFAELPHAGGGNKRR